MPSIKTAYPDRYLEPTPYGTPHGAIPLGAWLPSAKRGAGHRKPTPVERMRHAALRASPLLSFVPWPS